MCTTETTISAVKCKIIRHCDRNDFIYNLMKNIHIVEHKSVQKGEILTCIFLNKLRLNRIIPVQIDLLNAFFWKFSNLLIMVLPHGLQIGEQCSN